MCSTRIPALSAPAAARYLAEGYAGRCRGAFMHVPTGMASKIMALERVFIWKTPSLGGCTAEETFSAEE